MSVLDYTGEKPIFVIRQYDEKTSKILHEYRIWASGIVEGFPGKVWIFNRIHPTIAMLEAKIKILRHKLGVVEENESR